MSNAPEWSIVAKDGPNAGHSYLLTESGIQAGRSDECEVVLPSQNVSRKHARFFLYMGEPYVQDLGSRNGVFVNGARVQQQGLRAGDTVTMGELAFQVLSGAQGSRPANRRMRTVLLASVAAVVFMIIVAVVFRRPPPSGPTINLDNSAPTSNVGDLFDKFAKATPKPTEPSPLASTGENPGGQEQAADSVADRRNRMVKDYLERAELLQEAGKLTEALEHYERALKLDQGCTLCLTRKERIQKEIATLVQKHLDDGMKAYKALRYDEAVGLWERVINLSPDPGSDPHRQASQFIADAQEKLRSQR